MVFHTFQCATKKKATLAQYAPRYMQTVTRFQHIHMVSPRFSATPDTTACIPAFSPAMLYWYIRRDHVLELMGLGVPLQEADLSSAPQRHPKLLMCLVAGQLERVLLAEERFDCQTSSMRISVIEEGCRGDEDSRHL
jgi:hypothetical protein